MKILVLSDTHIPRSSHDLPQKVYDEIKNVDMIIHAGDMVEKEVYDKLSSLRPTTAVYGNMDSMKLKDVLKEKEIIDIDGVKIGLIHGYGASINIFETVKKEFKGVDVIVFGHTHKPVNEIRDGVLFFNPGSSTDTVFAPYNSYGLLNINKGKFEAEIIKIKC